MSNSSGHDVNKYSLRFGLSEQNFERYLANSIVDYVDAVEPRNRADDVRTIRPETDRRRRENRLGSTFPADVSRNNRYNGGIWEGAATRPLAPSAHLSVLKRPEWPPEDPPSYSEAIGSSRPVCETPRHLSPAIPSAHPVGRWARHTRPDPSRFTTVSSPRPVPPVGSSQQAAALHPTTVPADVGFGSKPCAAFCEGCRITVRTTTIITFSSKTYCCCFLMFFSGICCPLSFVPFLVLGRRKVVHACPQCKQVLGHCIQQ